MAHARIDVDLRLDERWDSVPDRYRADALALYVAAVLYSAEMLVDGRLTMPVIAGLCESWGIKKARFVNARLVETGLVRELRTGVFEIVDWSRYHSSRRDVEEQRKRATERKRRSRGQASLFDVTPDVTAGQAEKSQRDEGVPPARAYAGGQPQIQGPPSPPAGGTVTLTRRELRRYTGCRAVRGSHGSSFVRHPLGTDKPPATWPHDAPTEAEVLQALAELNGSHEPDFTEPEP